MKIKGRSLTDTDDWTPMYSSATWPSVSFLSPILLSLFVQAAQIKPITGEMPLGVNVARGVVADQLEGTSANVTMTLGLSESINDVVSATKFLEKLLAQSKETPVDLRRAINANLLDLL